MPIVINSGGYVAAGSDLVSSASNAGITVNEGGTLAITGDPNSSAAYVVLNGGIEDHGTVVLWTARLLRADR